MAICPCPSAIPPTSSMTSSMQSILQLVLGPMLVGFCLDIFLFGITTVQTYIYYLAFPGDRVVLQCLVYGVYLAGISQTGLALHDLFILYSTRYGYIKPDMSNDQPGWNSGLYFLFTVPICGSIVACAVQLFYAHRIYVLTKKTVIPCFIGVLAVLQWVGAILVAAGVYSGQIANNGMVTSPGGQQNMNKIGFIGSLLWSSTSSICDILVAVYMAFYLLKIRPSTTHSKMHVTKLIRLILETGSLTATISVSFVLTFLFSPGGFFVIPGLSIGKLYAISMLVLLNSRFYIQGGRERVEPSFMLPSELAEGNTTLSAELRFANDPAIVSTT